MKLAELLEDAGSCSEVAAQIAAFNRTFSDYPRGRLLHAVFAERAAATPAAIAVSDGAGRALTYGALDRASSHLARHLSAVGIAPEGIVALLIEDGLALIISMLAVLKAGGAYCPLEPSTPHERANHMLSAAHSKVLLTDMSHRAAALRLLPANASLACLVTLYEGAPPRAVSTHEHLVAIDAACADDGAVLAQSSSLGRLAYVMFTSGSSGIPKGVLVEHCAVLRLVMNNNYVQLGPNTRVLMTGSVAFDAATFEIWGPLLNGGTVVRPGRLAVLDPRELRHLLITERITTLWLTAGLFNQLVEADASMFASLQTLLVGGERLSPLHIVRVRRACPALDIVNGYGPTENTTFTTTHLITAEPAGDIPIGRPVANTEVLIVDAQGQLAAPGVRGEILAAGEGLARGYLADAALTADRFRPHPWRAGARVYNTRDLGRWTEDGVIEFLGRMDGQVKIRGYRIEPGEVEAACRECTGVAAAVVVPQDGPGAERSLVAYVTGPADTELVRQELRGRLPTYMVPRSILRLERLPLNSNGKVAVAQLPSPDWSRHTAAGTLTACDTETERILSEIWGEILGIEHLGADENFFELGGHSLHLTRLVASIQLRLAIEIPLATVFQSQTIRLLARALERLARHGNTLADEALVLLGGQATAPAVFALPPGTGDVLSYVPLAQRWPHLRLYAFNFLEAPTRLVDFADLAMQVQPQGPYVLLGYSGGGNLAFHLAAEFERRGQRVARIVMLDSGRILTPYPFLEDAVRETAATFLAHPAIQPYCDTPVLRDKVTRRITAYYRWLAQVRDTHCVDADIDVILNEAGDLEGRHAGELITSVPAWQSATRRQFTVHRGSGTHHQMLLEPALAVNAHLLETILLQAVHAACPGVTVMNAQ